MEKLCIICLSKSSGYDEFTCINYYSSSFRCHNHICSSCCKFNIGMTKYSFRISTHVCYISLCSTKCLINYFIELLHNKLNYPVVLIDKTYTLQHDIHNSIFLHKYLDNFIINDLTNIVIEYLV